MVPTEIIPTPAIALSISAPPFGYCSETTPRVVGQKKVLPKPYNVAARNNIPTAAPALDSHNRPAQATAAHRANRPSGEILCTIGPAKNRRMNMIKEVYTRNKIPLVGLASTACIMSEIQLSVPSSVVA